MAGSGATTAVDRGVRRAASLMTRRRFLRNVGTTALGMALSVALAGTHFAGRSFANTVNRPSDPCGPSPKCRQVNCQNNGQCKTGTNDNCRCRPYAGGTCEGCGYAAFPSGQCWVENYCGTGQGKWRCCDCCCARNADQGSICSSCAGAQRRRCICRIQLTC